MFGLRSARGRAILAGAVLLVLLISIATLAVWRAHDDQQRHHSLEHTAAAATALEHVQAQFWEAQATLSALILLGDPSLADAYHDTVASLEQNLSQARAWALAAGEADKVAALDDLAERIDHFTEQVNLALPAVLEADPETRVQLATASMSGMVSDAEAIIADLEELVDEEQQKFAASRAAADRAAETTLWLLIGFSAAAFLVAAGTVAMLILSVVRPLAALRASARAITAGDPEARARVSGPEEVASLARAFNEMTDALAAKTQEYIDTTNLTGDMIVRLDKDGRWNFLNDAACKFLGKPREELLGADSRAFVHPEDLEPTAQAIRETRARKELTTGFVNRFVTPMGTRVVEWNGYPLFAEEGQYAGIQITGRDITERKQAEEALRESEERYRDLFENANDLIQSIAPDGSFVYVNRAWREALGYGEDEIAGLSLFDIIHPDSKAYCTEMFQRVMAGEKLDGLEAMFVTKDGRTIWVEGSASCRFEDGKPVATRGIFRDVTDRKRAEEALRESEERYRNLFESTHDMIQSVAPDGRLLFVNGVWLETLGYSKAELPSLNLFDIIHPESLSHCQELFSRVMAGESTDHVEATFVAKDGRPIVVEGHATGRRVGSRLVATHGFFRDITDRKRAEQELASSEERLKILFESAPDAYYLNDLQGNFVDGNRAAEEMVGYKREELIGRNMLELGLLPPEQIPKAAAALAKHVQGLPSGPDEFTLIRKDGSQVPVEIRTFPVKIGEQTLVLGIARDITDRKRAEEQRERLHAELEVRAITDGLTGLYNHAHFFQRLAEEIERSKRYDRGFAVVMMDVDNFKHYNDSRGHQAGDEGLCLLGDCIRTAIRRSDLAFRYGGDEFAAILLHADSSKAQAVVKRINRCVTKRLKEAHDPAAAWLRLDAGVACFPDDATTADDLVRIADAALYDAKRLAWARGAMGQGQPIASPASPSASELASALRDLSVPDVLADLDLHTIAAVGAAAEIKDPHIREHQERVSRWAAALAEEMGLPPNQVQEIRIVGLLHDLGKVSISEHILNKPGKLTEEEFAKVKQHAALGAMVVGQVEGFRQLVPIIRHHHERFDGKGYPDGLTGEDIPLEARILSVVDVFDAMTHHRSYRQALSREKAIAELERGAGTQFDAAAVKAFLGLVKRRGEDLAAPAQAASEDRQLAAATAAGRGKE